MNGAQTIKTETRSLIINGVEVVLPKGSSRFDFAVRCVALFDVVAPRGAVETGRSGSRGQTHKEAQR